MKESEVDHVFIVSTNRNTLRAPEANEILERTPSRLLRMGAWAVAILLTLMLSIGFFVRYPDTLEGSAIVTTTPLPIKLKTQQGGRVTQLLVPDNTIAGKDAVIAELENTTGYDNILTLQNTIDSIKRYMETDNAEAMARHISLPMNSLGDAQIYYNQLLQQVSAKILLQKEQLYKKRTQNLQQQIGKLQSIAHIAEQEKKMIEEELKQADERFKANEQLYKDKVISRQEYYDEAARLRQKRLQLEQQNQAIVQNNVNAGESSKQMLEIQYERGEKERTLTVGIEEAMRNIANYIQSWRQKYLIVAPYQGVIHYLRPLQENEPTTAGEDLFAIIPLRHKYEAVIMLASTGIGKVAVGQKVHLLLDNFPYNEFGFLEGTISKRSTLPETTKGETGVQSSYRVYVKLSDTLQTNYHKDIPFSPEMTATARIITRDRNLLQRLMAGIAKNDK